MSGSAPICPYCGATSRLVPGLDVYAHRRDLWAKRFWKCPCCVDVWVGCHPPATPGKGGGQGDGTIPLGRLANGELRSAKQAAHAAFDPLWRGGAMRRREAYKWLAKELGIKPRDTHIGEFDQAQCRAVVQAVERFHEQKAAA